MQPATTCGILFYTLRKVIKNLADETRALIELLGSRLNGIHVCRGMSKGLCSRDENTPVAGSHCCLHLGMLHSHKEHRWLQDKHHGLQ